MAKQIKKINTPDLAQPLTAKLLGEAVKARRTQSNLRLEDAAALCGVAKQTFMNVEHGLQTSQIDSLLKIFTGLGIKLSIIPWIENDEHSNDWQ